jgi:GAF domain-containing protein
MHVPQGALFTDAEADVLDCSRCMTFSFKRVTVIFQQNEKNLIRLLMQQQAAALQNRNLHRKVLFT